MDEFGLFGWIVIAVIVFVGLYFLVPKFRGKVDKQIDKDGDGKPFK